MEYSCPGCILIAICNSKTILDMVDNCELLQKYIFDSIIQKLTKSAHVLDEIIIIKGEIFHVTHAPMLSTRGINGEYYEAVGIQKMDGKPVMVGKLDVTHQQIMTNSTPHFISIIKEGDYK